MKINLNDLRIEIQVDNLNSYNSRFMTIEHIPTGIKVCREVVNGVEFTKGILINELECNIRIKRNG